MEEEIMILKTGQKFLHTRKKIVYMVTSVKNREIIIVSEDGSDVVITRTRSLAFSTLRPIYD
jgi:hypothetical protein